MLPSTRLRPAQFAALVPRQQVLACWSAARKFSSIPRNLGSSLSPYRTSSPQCARWRTSATGNSHVVVTASSIRYASWYAPWTWGRTNTPSPPNEQLPAENLSNSAIDTASTPAEPVMSDTPELAPAGIDKEAVVNDMGKVAASTTNTTSIAPDTISATMDELLSNEPLKDSLPKVKVDPTALIDHAGHMKELGLEYGWGVTSVFQNIVETIYLNTNFGWAGTIVAAGAIVRCGLFVFQARSSHSMAALASLRPITDPLKAKEQAARERGDLQQAEIYKTQQHEVMRPHISGMWSVGGLMIVQGWIGFCAFRFLRAMSEMPMPGMSTDGILWFTDLTLRDPYFILPAAISATMFTVFTTTGETGVQNSMNAATRKIMFGAISVMFGIITSFQASGLQLYFVMSSVLGGITGWILRQNSFRRFFNMNLIPTPASNAMYSKVIRGEVKLRDISSPTGKVKYQSPNAGGTTSKSSTKTITTTSCSSSSIKSRAAAPTTFAGLNIKAGTTVPTHLQREAPKPNAIRPDRDMDYDMGPQGSIRDRMSFYYRNYKPSFVMRRLSDHLNKQMAQSEYGRSLLEKAQDKRRREAEAYEVERKRRFQNKK